MSWINLSEGERTAWNSGAQGLSHLVGCSPELTGLLARATYMAVFILFDTVQVVVTSGRRAV